MYNNPLALDFETSTAPNHLPWLPESFVVMLNCQDNNGVNETFWFNHDSIEYTQQQVNQNISRIQELIDTHDVVVAHNASFEIFWLWELGVDLSSTKFFDTKVAVYLLYGQDRRKSTHLGDLAAEAGVPPKLDKVAEFWAQGYNTNEIPISILEEYCSRDVEIALMLYQLYSERLQQQGMWDLAVVQFDVLPALCEMSYNGINVDIEVLREYEKKYETCIEDITWQLNEMVGYEINWASPNEKSAALFGGIIKRSTKEPMLDEDGNQVYFMQTIKEPLMDEKLGVQKVWLTGKKKGELRYKNVKVPNLEKPRYNTTVSEEYLRGMEFTPPEGSESKTTAKDKELEDDYRVYNTSDAVTCQLGGVNKFQRSFLELLSLRSKLQQQLSTFFVGLQKHVIDGVVHGKQNQTVTVTGRLSATNPNTANFPRGGTAPVKKSIKPRSEDHFIMSGDLGQIEWRAAGQLSKDAEIIREILSDVDVHTDNAIKVLGDVGLRTLAKIVTFRKLYFGSAHGFHKDPTMPSYPLSRWEEISNNWDSKYSGFINFTKDNIKKVKNSGELVSPFGRKFVFVPDVGWGGAPKFNSSQIANYIIQGTSWDIMALVLHNIKEQRDLLNLDAVMRMVVHDALISDCHKFDVEAMCEVYLDTFELLPTTIKDTFHYNWTVPLSGDIEIGTTYGDIFVVVTREHGVTMYKTKTMNEPKPTYPGWFLDVVEA